MIRHALQIVMGLLGIIPLMGGLLGLRGGAPRIRAMGVVCRP
jgi:hypothetical protein